MMAAALVALMSIPMAFATASVVEACVQAPSVPYQVTISTDDVPTVAVQTDAEPAHQKCVATASAEIFNMTPAYADVGVLAVEKMVGSVQNGAVGAQIAPAYTQTAIMIAQTTESHQVMKTHNVAAGFAIAITTTTATRYTPQAIVA